MAGAWGRTRRRNRRAAEVQGACQPRQPRLDGAGNGAIPAWRGARLRGGRYHPSTPVDTAPRSVLLVRLSALGDVVHGLSALAALRAAWPDARLGWAVEDRFAGLLEGHPQLDRLVVLPRRRLVRELRALHLGAAARTLRASAAAYGSEPWDLVVDLQSNLRSAVSGWASGAAVRVGWDAPRAREGAQRLHTRSIAAAPGLVLERDRCLELLTHLGVRAPSARPLVPIADAARERVAAALRALGAPEPVLLHPGVSGFGALKAWAPARWAELAARLAERAPVLVSHGPGEEPLASQVVAAAAHPLVRPAPATASLHELSALCSMARLFVACDTGPLHLAAALGRPVVGLYGPTDPRRHGPWSPDGLARSVSAGAWCSPCARRRCAATTCMSALAPEAVLAAVAELLPELADQPAARLSAPANAP